MGIMNYEFEDLKMKYDARFTIYEAELNHLLPTPNSQLLLQPRVKRQLGMC